MLSIHVFISKITIENIEVESITFKLEQEKMEYSYTLNPSKNR